MYFYRWSEFDWNHEEHLKRGDLIIELSMNKEAPEAVEIKSIQKHRC